MARRGAKPTNPKDKEARGTLQPVRDIYEVIHAPDGVVRMPDGFPGDAHDIWDEYADHAVAMGTLKPADVHTFATWCVMTAQIRMAWKDIRNNTVPASVIQQWRTLGEMFGLAGEKSRIVLKVQDGGKDQSNPWAKHGRNRT